MLRITVDSEWVPGAAPGYVPVRWDITNLGDDRTIEIVGTGSRVSRLARFRQSRPSVRQRLQLRAGDRVRFTMPVPVQRRHGQHAVRDPRGRPYDPDQFRLGESAGRGVGSDRCGAERRVCRLAPGWLRAGSRTRLRTLSRTGRSSTGPRGSVMTTCRRRNAGGTEDRFDSRAGAAPDLLARLHVRAGRRDRRARMGRAGRRATDRRCSRGQRAAAACSWSMPVSTRYSRTRSDARLSPGTSRTTSSGRSTCCPRLPSTTPGFADTLTAVDRAPRRRRRGDCRSSRSRGDRRRRGFRLPIPGVTRSQRGPTSRSSCCSPC